MPEQVLEGEIKNKPLCKGFLSKVCRKLILLKLSFNFCMTQLLLFPKYDLLNLGCGLSVSAAYLPVLRSEYMYLNG